MFHNHLTHRHTLIRSGTRMEGEHDPLRPQVDFVYLNGTGWLPAHYAVQRAWTSARQCRNISEWRWYSDYPQKNVCWMGWTSTGKSLIAQLKSVILLSQARNLICIQEKNKYKYKNRDKKHKDKREINAPWQQRPPSTIFRGKGIRKLLFT